MFLSSKKPDGSHIVSPRNLYGVSEDSFGVALDPVSLKEHKIRRFTFRNNHNMTVQVINFGATITKIIVPDSNGITRDVVLGFDDIKDYVNPKRNPYFGAVVGRVANRIANGEFKLDDKKIKLTRNWKDKHTVHGGNIGFNRFIWDIDALEPEKCELRLKHVSLDGHEGFPGTVTATIDYKLTETNEFVMKFKATTDKPTPINLTNHTYFNLNGHGTGKYSLRENRIKINANDVLEVYRDLIPTGKLLVVTGTTFDFLKLKKLGKKIKRNNYEGYDHYFPLIQSSNDLNPMRLVALARDAEHDIRLAVLSDQRGLQFYTGNGLPDIMKMQPAIIGKDKATYTRQSAFCFLPHGYPDAVNHSIFPSVVVNPKETYEHNLIYEFSTRKIAKEIEDRERQENKRAEQGSPDDWD